MQGATVIYFSNVQISAGQEIGILGDLIPLISDYDGEGGNFVIIGTRLNSRESIKYASGIEFWGFFAMLF